MITMSFFSYKGGSGRTSLLCNTIPFLARELNASPDHPIVIVDCDTESAGLTFLLDCHKERQQISIQHLCNNGIPEYDKDYEHIYDHPFFKSLPQVAEKFGFNMDGYNGSILFLPADLGMVSTKEENANPFQLLRKACKDRGVSALIFDTPSGDQKTARWATSISNEIVTVMRVTNQFRLGTQRYFKNHLNDWENKKIIICPNAVPLENKIQIDGKIINLEEVKEKEFIDKFNEIFSDSETENELNLEMLEDDNFGVNEVNRFKYSESILFKVKKDTMLEDERKARESYERLARILVN